MESNLISRREDLMDKAERAVEAVWPERQGPSYLHEMKVVAKELEKIAAEMEASSVDRVEQSRTYRYLGNVYSDLAPAIGKEMLVKAMEVYQKAENIIAGHEEEIELAKINFNFANTLRQVYPDDAEQLQQAKSRLQAAREIFAQDEPQHLPQIDSLLQLIERLSTIGLSGIVQTETDRVSEQISWIKEHNATLGSNFFAAPGAPDPYLQQANRQKEIDNASEVAKAEILKPSVLKYVCPALQSVTGDVFDVSKILVGVLVPLSIASTITISWNPLVIAAGAFLIVRAGIAGICKDLQTDKSKK